MEPFNGLNSSQRISIFTAVFDDGAGGEETLKPMQNNTALALSRDQVTSIWIDIYIPSSADGSKVYLSKIRLGTAIIPVELYVFDFTISNTFHYVSMLGISATSADFMTLLWEHRFILDSPTWPSGFSYKITWENTKNPKKCEQFYDEYDEHPEYSIKYLSQKFLRGIGWDGRSWSSALIVKFVSNSEPRPSTFCGISRGPTHQGTAEYNNKWSEYLTALDKYLKENGYSDNTYFYVQNEPQTQADLDLANYLCNLYKKAAPGLKIAISEEPKETMVKNGTSLECGYDYYIAYFEAFRRKYAYDRLSKFPQETLWIYSLPQTPSATWSNPTVAANPGIHSRILSWLSWSIRARGWAYYDFSIFFHNSIPGVRAKILRQSFNDYEYLFTANGQAHPVMGTKSKIDDTVLSVAKNLNEFNRFNDIELDKLKVDIGYYIEKKITLPPILTYSNSLRKRNPYYVKFGSSSSTQLVYDNKAWIQVGWEKYNTTVGCGFLSQNFDTNILKYGSSSSGNVLEKTFLFDDYGRVSLFIFDIENGKYNVTVSVGYPGKAYSDPHNVRIYGQWVIDDQPTTAAKSILKASAIVDITDSRLDIAFAGYSEKISNYAYTFFQYAMIEPI